MPKRSHKNEDIDYLRRKLRKIEKKLEKCRERERSQDQVSRYSSGSSPAPLDVDSAPELEVESGLQSVDLVTFSGNEPQLSASAAEINVIDAQQPGQSVETEPTVPVSDPQELDEDILQLLGETPSKDKNYGPEIRGELAVRWEHIATAGLSRDIKKELLEKHLVPSNCTRIDAPKLNPEIKAALSEILIKKDKALESKQKQVTASISCLSEALTRLFTLEHRDQTVIKLLIEAGRLMCDTQHNESMTRRSFICSTIKKDFKDQLFNTEIDSFLFGEKLADTLKTAKAISKSGAEIKIAPTRKTTPAQKPRQVSSQSSLNRRPPLQAARQAGAARRFEPAPTMAAPRLRAPAPQRTQPRSQHQSGPRR